MSRRSTAKKRLVNPDPVYNSTLASMIINRILLDGKKSVARRIFYQSMHHIQEKTQKHPMDILERAMRNVTPLVEVKARRVGGSTYQVPMEVDASRGTALALRWIISSARTRSGRTMAMKLANELVDASEENGAAVRKRNETHRMAEANKAFAHFRY